MKKIIFNIAFLLTTVAVVAQVDRSKMPEPGPAPKIELGEVQSFTLENGLKVFVVENHKLPKVAFSLEVDRDPIVEGNKAGLTDLAGELLSKGTKTMGKDDFNFAIDFIGADFFTSSQSVYAASLKKHQNKLLQLMSDVVKNADFKVEELEKIRTQMISGIQSEKDDPDAIARNVRRALLYGKDHPYGEIMTEESVKNVTLEDVKKYYATYFKPNISYLAVVGDITVKEAKPLVTKYFGDWKRGEVPTHKYEMPKQPQSLQVAFVNKPGAVQSVISAFNTIDLKPGTEESVKATITNGILGGGFVSKLNLNLREAHSYTYGARSRISSDEVVGNFNASAKVRNEVSDSALTEMLKELMNMRDGKVTEDELKTIKNFRTGTFAIGLEDAQTKARYAINMEKYNMPKEFYANYLKKVEATTLEDVNMISKKFINPMNGYILVVGNQEEVAEKIKKFSPTGQMRYFDTFGNEVAETTMKAAPEGMTAETVINDYLKAIGGKETLNKVKSLKQEMTVSMQGMSLSAMSIHQQPNNFLSEMKMGEMVAQKQVYNGTKGAVTSRGATKEMTAEELADMKIEAHPFPEMAYLKNKVAMSLKGIDTKNGEEVYAVEVVLPNDKKQMNYYAVKSGLKTMETSVEESPMGAVTVESAISDYKETDGVMFPQTVIQTFGPQKLEMKVSNIEVNGKIDGNMFKL